VTNLVTIFGFQSCLRLILDIPALATSVEDISFFFWTLFCLSLEELILELILIFALLKAVRLTASLDSPHASHPLLGDLLFFISSILEHLCSRASFASS
jgi:hypothetical protein